VSDSNLCIGDLLEQKLISGSRSSLDARSDLPDIVLVRKLISCSRSLLGVVGADVRP
jgi:hypothetical protein